MSYLVICAGKHPWYLAAAIIVTAWPTAFAQYEAKPYLQNSVDAEAQDITGQRVDNPPAFLVYDAMKVVPHEMEQCGTCHKAEAQAWTASTHYRTYTDRHWTREAQSIVKRMGARSLRRNGECSLCHYTETAYTAVGETRAVAGVSCQRCHGPAMDWFALHNEQGSFDAHGAELEARGMRTRESLYELYSTCYQCHTVPRETLVNEGRHRTGTLTFELVEWAEGEVRHHNFRLRGREGNQEATIEHRRFMYVLGRMLELEYGLRALSFAEEDGRYSEAQQERVRAAVAALSEIDVDIPELGAAIKAAEALLNSPEYASLPIEGRKAYTECAQKISGFARNFEERRNSYLGRLAKIDPLLPTEYRGTVFRAR